MKSKFLNIKNISGLGVLSALVIVLQLLSNYVQFGPVSITLALFPIAVGAMLYGPLGGLYLGLLDGVMVLLAPSTISFFFAIAPVGTIFTCLLKTGLAGLLAGFVFKLNKTNIRAEFIVALIIFPILLLSATEDIFVNPFFLTNAGQILKKIIRLINVLAFIFFIFKGLFKPMKNPAVILTSLTVPIVNTGLFIVASITIFYSTINPMAESLGQNILAFLIFSFIGWNFFLEFAINAALASAFQNAYVNIEKRTVRKKNSV